MNMKTEKVVMMDSDEAASIQTVTGWVDRQGRFWGSDEHQARWSGATHRKCKNKPDEHPIHSTNGYCEECHRESRQAKSPPMSARYGPESRWLSLMMTIIFSTLNHWLTIAVSTPCSRASCS